MSQVFTTRQFQAGNSQAVRIPIEIAFAPKTELLIIREGNRLIIEPKEELLGDEILELFAELKPYFSDKREDIEITERNWS